MSSHGNEAKDNNTNENIESSSQAPNNEAAGTSSSDPPRRQSRHSAHSKPIMSRIRRPSRDDQSVNQAVSANKTTSPKRSSSYQAPETQLAAAQSGLEVDVDLLEQIVASQHGSDFVRNSARQNVSNEHQDVQSQQSLTSSPTRREVSNGPKRQQQKASTSPRRAASSTSPKRRQRKASTSPRRGASHSPKRQQRKQSATYQTPKTQLAAAKSGLDDMEDFLLEEIVASQHGSSFVRSSARKSNSTEHTESQTASASLKEEASGQKQQQQKPPTAAQNEDDFLLQKIIASRHGSSFVGQSNTSIDSRTQKNDPNERAGARQGETKASIQNQQQPKSSPIIPTPRESMSSTDSGLRKSLVERYAVPDYQSDNTGESEDLDELMAMRHGQSMIINGVNANSHIGESSGTDRDNTNAPYTRQKTPAFPGAYHRTGSRIESRGKGTLTSSMHNSEAPPSNITQGTAAAAESVSAQPPRTRTSRRARISQRSSQQGRRETQQAESGNDNMTQPQNPNDSAGPPTRDAQMADQEGETGLASRRNQFRRREEGNGQLEDAHGPSSDSRSPGAVSCGGALASCDACQMTRMEEAQETLGEGTGSQEFLARVFQSRSSTKSRNSTKSEFSELEDSFFMNRPSDLFGSFGDLDISESENSEEADVEQALDDSAAASTRLDNAPPYQPDNQPFRDLVEARAVTGESAHSVFNANPLDLDERAKREYAVVSYRRKVTGCVCLLIAVIIVVVVSVTATRGGSEPSIITPAVTSTAPTQAPTLAPTSNIIFDIPEMTKTLIQSDPDGPQGLAYQWLLDDPNLRLYSQERIVQRFALAVIYYATSMRGPGWTKDTDWLSHDIHECEWYFRGDGENLRPCGTLDEDSESYRNLLLYGNGLEGSIPQELFLLTSLERIDLQKNRLVGTIPAPTWLEDTPYLWPKKLELIALVNNRLTGALPTELGYFTSLEALYVGSNQLSGVIPTELGLASNLVDLAMENNEIGGMIPAEFSNLHKMVQFSLGDNKLTGPLTHVFQTARSSVGEGGPVFPFLQEFDVSGNQLLGEIPPQLGLACPNLTKLAAPSNHLSGSLPSEIWSMRSLTTLDLENNKLAIHQLPTELGQLTDLVHLRLKSPSTRLGGTIPSELGLLSSLSGVQLDASSFADNGETLLFGTMPTQMGLLGNATSILLSGHRLTGPIPTEFGRLTSLEKLWLNYNAVMGTTILGLDGSLPSELGRLPLKELVLSENSLTGPIPSELAQLSRLETLSLHTNRLSKTIPEELGESMPRLKDLVMYRNFLSGTISAEGLGAMKSLENLNLLSNRLQGGIPTEIGMLSKLESFRADSNYFSGTIPSEIGNAVNLNRLVLIGSGIRGSLPTELGQLHASLVYLYLGGNLLTGTIPSTIGLLSHLEALDMPQNTFQGRLPTELGLMTSLRAVFLYQNFLSGDTPSQIGSLGANITDLFLLANSLSSSLPTQMGRLTMMKGFSVMQNQMTGSLPSEMGLLQQLTTLSLAENMFVGTIPTELGSFSHLEQFAFYENRFAGSVPSELGRLHSVKEFLVESNQLSSTIPTELGLLTNVERLRFQSNSISGSVPTEISFLSLLVDLSFSSNQMNGTVPFGELSSLPGLQQLWLSDNQFTGILATEVGLLSNSLSVLSLSFNQLSSNIPSQLGRLSNLLALELSFNPLLSGTIPTELALLTNLLDAVSGVAGTELTGTVPDELCTKVLFDCSPQLCGCDGCVCATAPPLIEVGDTVADILAAQKNNTAFLVAIDPFRNGTSIATAPVVTAEKATATIKSNMGG